MFTIMRNAAFLRHEERWWWWWKRGSPSLSFVCFEKWKVDPFILNRTEKSIDQSKALDELGRVRLGIIETRGVENQKY